MAGAGQRFTIDDFRRAARAPSTRRAYHADWRDFTAWCKAKDRSSLPADPTTVARFLAERANELRPASLDRRLAAIRLHHREAGLPLDLGDPVIRDVRLGIRRILGTAPVQKDPLTPADIESVCATLPGTLAGLRDRALILLGYAAALRRSELATLTLADLRFTAEGVVLSLPRTKEDQTGWGSVVGVPRGSGPRTCPVTALKMWLIAARLDSGHVFRPVDRHGNAGGRPLSGNAIALIIKRAVALAGERAGWTRTEIRRKVAATAGHSLRAGLVTAAVAAGAGEIEVQKHTRHARLETTKRYVRLARLFTGNPAARLGL